MIYELFVLKNGENKTYTYDTAANVFYDENGKKLLEDVGLANTTDNILDVEPFTADQNKYLYSDHMNNLHIDLMLGFNCNFDCKYCSQKSFKNIHKVHSATPKDVETFISVLKESKIHPMSIQLWGGEPLVYWKVIQKLVPRLREEYPNLEISFPTNGSLLTREKIDFCKKYNLRFWVSHDGCGNEKRVDADNPDIMNDPVVYDAIQYAHEVLPSHGISFKTTLTRGNTNQEKIIRFFKTKVHKDAFVSANNVVTCHDAKDADVVYSATLTSDDITTLQDTTFSTLNVEEGKYGDKSMEIKKKNLIDSFLRMIPVEKLTAECGMPFGSAIAIDMLGNILKCHNFGRPKDMGNIRDLNGVSPYGFTHLSNRLTDCPNCLVVHSCKGGCPGIDNDSHKITCPNLYALNYGTFKAAMAAIFGVYLISARARG